MQSAAPQRGAGYFDAEAPAYDAAYTAPTPAGYTLRARTEAALGLVGAGPGRALDIGMGPGRLVERLAARGWTVSGVDSSAAMVELARRRVPDASGRLVEGRIEALPFPDAAFEAVVALGVLEYATDPWRAVLELRRVLAPGGLAVVSVANSRAPYVRWRQLALYPLVRTAKRVAPRGRPAPPLRRLIPLARFRRLLAEAGFAVEERRYVALYPILSPLDDLLPRPSVAVASALATRAPALGPVLGVHVVFAARRGLA